MPRRWTSWSWGRARGKLRGGDAALDGADVLVIERRPEMGVPVRCGEFMPQVDEIGRSSLMLGRRRAADVDLPICAPSKREEIRIYSPKLRSFDVGFHGYTTYRDRFDQFLAKGRRRPVRG